MSELKELTYDVITNAFIKALADIDKGTGIRDKHFVAATELIIKNFKAHIKGCEIPEFKRTHLTAHNTELDWYLDGIEAYRKALVESLE